MPISRRSLFGQAAAVLTAALLPLRSKAKNSSDDTDAIFSLTKRQFPLTYVTRFYFPKGKTEEQILQDMDSWTDAPKMRRLFTELSKAKKIGPRQEFLAKKDYYECRLFFKKSETVAEFHQELDRQEIVNLDLQKSLGYRVVTELIQG